jgi:hypothetical protein
MLPRLLEINASFKTNLPVRSGIFNHPIIILSKQTYNGKLAVLIISLATYYPTSCSNAQHL